MDTDTSKIIQEATETLLTHLECPSRVEVVVTEERSRKHVMVNIDSEHSRHLIGQYGATLRSLQHMVRLIVSAKTNKPCLAQLDVNGYRAERESKVDAIAREAAEKAVRTDSMVILKPMSSYERRLVHVALQKEKGISTESLGQEPNRRVVVKPAHDSQVVESFSDKGFTLDDINV
jgi:spoIIIJ-associated protein